MPEPVTISRLVPVGVKLVWPMEASSFTPWLLANAAVLGDVLGIDLELRAAEHKVGGFSLDLIGRDAESDEVVIVENQFGPTDHRHLGQLLTYAGGTEPATVVWIAEQFRDEHRAALDWLNARTDSSTRFFGVRLGAVTIQGAPTGLVAPLFELVVQPNDWGKAIKSPTTDPESKRAPLYLRFWGDWLDRVKPYGWTNRKPPQSIGSPCRQARLRGTPCRFVATDCSPSCFSVTRIQRSTSSAGRCSTRGATGSSEFSVATSTSTIYRIARAVASAFTCMARNPSKTTRDCSAATPRGLKIRRSSCVTRLR